ncbi:quinate 5-dehydrogenase [Coprothermobacteraceae bacterium]|nr:quinate 5-dehydrogenase [Coprothermobacteraceae bacterium]
MKHVVSVSIGSSKRDSRAEAEFLGESFLLERIGTDGNVQKAIEKIAELDGKVDAIGLGGIDLYLWLGKKRYLIKDAQKLAKAARKTPVVDGSGLKHTLEKFVVADLFERGIFRPGMKFLVTSAVDRWGMLEGIHSYGGQLIIGDLMFALDVAVPLRTIGSLKAIGSLILPIAVRLPFQVLYPTGHKQLERKPKFGKYFAEADVIAGDYLYIDKYMPERLDGKIVLTNTTTPDNVNELRRRGVKLLVTTTPVLNGRSFGTNVMEGVFTALLGRPGTPPDFPEYVQLIKELRLGPTIRVLQED